MKWIETSVVRGNMHGLNFAASSCIAFGKVGSTQL